MDHPIAVQEKEAWNKFYKSRLAAPVIEVRASAEEDDALANSGSIAKEISRIFLATKSMQGNENSEPLIPRLWSRSSRAIPGRLH